MAALTGGGPGAELTARQVEVGGIVQGVGFRPYIYRLARDLGLRGEVSNTGAGVTIIVEGVAPAIDAFLEALPRQKPPLASIVQIAATIIPPAGRYEFVISASRGSQRRNTLISPDVAVCADCLQELFDPQDRRYRYPFINCTHCGPRYTIIDDIPYDRPNTAMRGFVMCDRCQAEYDDPADRRFHAQPNACPVCGPAVQLLDSRRRPVATGDPIAATARLLKDGFIVALKGLGGFHLAVDACRDVAVALLRERKQREEKPLAVMASTADAVRSFAHLDAGATLLLESPQRPIVLLPKRLPERLAFSVAPRNHYYGVMLPYTPLHYLLLREGFTALVMTSANPGGEPIVIANDEAFQRLAGIADYFLVHDRPILLRADDSIVRRVAGQVRPLRRSRGYVPAPLRLGYDLPPLLACGAELKNTVCLTKADQAFVSQHIGDLENLETHAFFEATIAHLQCILDIEPAALACDLHPDYFSTQWAKSRTTLPLIEVQHHHAHIAACMAEHHLQEPVIGLALDGTGLGTDNTIWGGELLLADLRGFERLAHLETVPMPGGSMAIKEPWRMGVAWLQQTLGERFRELDLPLLRLLDYDRVEVVRQMVQRRINAPLTSSLGRLFDAVAAIIGLRTKVSYEGQAAMELEMIADGQEQPAYPFTIEEGSPQRIMPGPLITALVEDLGRGVPAFVISRRFHATVIDMWVTMCAAVRSRHRIDRVVLGGGCFQNVLLLQGLGAKLEALGFKVYAPVQLPVNDGGLALGQAVVAGANMA